MKKKPVNKTHQASVNQLDAKLDKIQKDIQQFRGEVYNKLDQLRSRVDSLLNRARRQGQEEEEEDEEDDSVLEHKRRIVVAALSTKRKARTHHLYPTLYLKGFVHGNRDNFNEPVWTEDVDKAMYDEEQYADMGQILSKMQDIAKDDFDAEEPWFYGLDPERYKYPQLVHLIQDRDGDWVEGS